MRSPPTAKTREQLFSALDRTALDPQAWPDVCDGLSDLVGGAGAVFIPMRVQARIPGVPYSPRIAELVQTYMAGWTDRDYRGDRGFPVIMAHGVAADQDFSTTEQISRCPFYNELLAPFGLKWSLSLSFAVSGDVWAVTIQGREADGPFLRAEKESLAELRQHLSIAAKRAAGLGFNRVENWKSCFEASDRAVLGLDYSGRVRLVSPEAERFVCGALQLRGGHLFAADPIAHRRLSALVQAAIDYDPRRQQPMPAPLTLRDIGGHSLSIDALPVPRDYQSLLTNIIALLVLQPVEDRAASVERALRNQFGLTPAEVRLALSMAEGAGVQQAQEKFGVSRSTVRGHLKSVFAKTETHRQSELVALMAKLAD